MTLRPRAALLCGPFGLLRQLSALAQSEDLAALSRTAKQLMAEGHFEEAIPICEQLVKAMPGTPGLVLNLGLAEEMAGHPAQAVPRFEEVLKADPGNVPALTSLATVQLQLNQSAACPGSAQEVVDSASHRTMTRAEC